MTVSLVNLHHLVQIHKQENEEKVFSFVMRTLSIYSFNNFQIIIEAVLTVFMLYITS